jgi:hypothetical protein
MSVVWSKVYFCKDMQEVLALAVKLNVIKCLETGEYHFIVYQA